MEGMNTVLAALDLEAGSDAVMRRAAQLAGAHAARLVILHVIDLEPLFDVGPGEGGLRDRLRRHAVSAIAPMLAECEASAQVRVEFGSPHDVIMQVAREQGAGLVLVGPGKDRTLVDKFLGSTADRVVRTATAPVLVVRKPSVEPYRSVAVAVDGSAQSASAFTEAMRLAPGADFQLVHAVDIPLGFRQAMLRAGTSPAEIDRYRAARAEKARAALSAFRRDVLKAPSLPLHILDGEPGPALLRFAKEASIDLLALGTHGRGAALQALLGSVARRILSHAACDVLLTSAAGE